MKKGKLFAPFLMLLAGLTASIMMFYFKYSTEQMLWILLLVLVTFYLIGLIIQQRVTSFVNKIKEEEAREGEVIEKEASDETEADEDSVKAKMENGIVS